MYMLIQLTPRKFIVVKHTGFYGVLNGQTVDPEEAHHGTVVHGPCEYSQASAYFIDHTKPVASTKTSFAASDGSKFIR